MTRKSTTRFQLPLAAKSSTRACGFHCHLQGIEGSRANVSNTIPIAASAAGGKARRLWISMLSFVIFIGAPAVRPIATVDAKTREALPAGSDPSSLELLRRPVEPEPVTNSGSVRSDFGRCGSGSSLHLNCLCIATDCGNPPVDQGPTLPEKLPLRHDEARMPGKGFKDVTQEGSDDVPARTLRRAATTSTRTSPNLSRWPDSGPCAPRLSAARTCANNSGAPKGWSRSRPHLHRAPRPSGSPRFAPTTP